MHDVKTEEYGHSLSTVFGFSSKETFHGYQDEDDPILDYLRVLDYRYVRLIFQPLDDQFILNSRWTDPQWTNTRILRHGLDAEQKDMRAQVFGKNVLEIQQKSILQLLMDEVRRLAEEIRPPWASYG